MYHFKGIKLIWLLLLFDGLVLGSCYYVELQHDGPIVRGGQISFKASVYDSDSLASGSFKYDWKDNAIPEHTKQNQTKEPVDTWSITYNRTMYHPGPYTVEVAVCKYFVGIICYDIDSIRVTFFINETLNGDIMLLQKNESRVNNFVSNADTVVHNISIKQTDMEFIEKAPTILTYWFVDCVYYGFRRDFEFPFNYTQADQEHTVEALVIADFTPLPPPPTTTTTTTTTTSTTTTVKPKTTTTLSTTTTPKPTTTKLTTTPTSKNVTTAKSVAKRAVNTETTPGGKTQTKQIMVNVNGTLVPYNGTFPYICNGTRVATDPDKTYGYFFKNIQVRAPVSKINVTGNNWLQHGELLTLKVKCEASKNLKYCVQFETGAYNVTGNETCPSYEELDTCDFRIQRYFGESTVHTIIIIIENEVSKKVTPVTVTVYKVKQQAQLSVIVVPVAFSLVAVVLIVFGVAYYIQNRSRFVVEVADFNFGQNYSDMEYKTFKERLRDSISNAFFSRGPSPGSSEVPVWPPGRKYGSMTS